MKKQAITKAKLFGTDGIRGTPGEYPLTDGMLSKIGNGIARFILNTQYSCLAGRQAIPNTKPRCKILIGKDTRLSGGKIETLLAKAIKRRGIDVLLVGIITTPGLSFLIRDLKADMGIMISASHNKATDNGIKFFDSAGFKLSCEDEERIEDIIFDALTHKAVNHNHIRPGKIIIIKTAQAKYVKFLISTLQGINLKGLRVALDCAWGAAAPFAKRIFTRLGAQVYSIHDKPRGHSINEGGAINPGLLKKLVLKKNADIGVAVDGDGDRGILIDENGEVLDGDCTMAVVARHLSKKNMLAKNSIVATVMSNYGLKEALDEFGGKIISAQVGDKYVLQALLDNGLNFGGEQSGHIIFLDYLSTPDGLLTALQVLKIMKETKLPLSNLRNCITKFPQILVNVVVKERRPFEKMPLVNEKLRLFNSQLKDNGRILLRYSGTEALARVMVEGRDQVLIETIAGSLADEIRQEIGV